MKPTIVKTTGYLVSTLSVMLLDVVSWKAAQQSPVLIFCLIGGVLCSVPGMAMRWHSYQRDGE